MKEDKFKNDFSQLLLQYTSPSAVVNDITPELHSHLTNQQIVHAIYDVLRNTLNINLENFNDADFKTPINHEIVITTPNAPDVLKMDYSHNNTLLFRDVSSKSSEILPNLADENMDTSDNETPVVTEKEIKNETNLQDRSILGKMLLNTEEKENLREKLQKELENVAEKDKTTMYNTIDEARKDALKVVNKLELIREILVPELQPIRRLSSIMNIPKAKYKPQLPSQLEKSSDGPSSNLRTIQRVKALRRSAIVQPTDVPLTPTSRLSLPAAPPPSPIRPVKKQSGIAVRVSSRLSSQSSGTSRTSTSNSNSSTLLSETGKSSAAPSKSPGKSKHSKYAYVQSTIPKPISVKRKAP